YTTDGGTKDTLDKGAIPEEGVYAAVDFSTGDDPLPIFELQKRYNAPGKSPRLSAEFYTGWLTHWGEPNVRTDANLAAASLEKILSLNASAVLYMAHGGTNFGFFNGANTNQNESDYKPDLTSYDYDAPIKESGDVDNPKYRELRNVIAKYSKSPLPPVPSGNGRAEYRMVKVNKIGSLFDALDLMCLPTEVVETKEPVPMELVGQRFGFLLYESEFSEKESKCTLSIPKVHDRAQVFVSCSSKDDQGRPVYVGIIQRGSNCELEIPNIKCSLKIRLFILVENMGHVNYGPYIYDRKGILSSVALDGNNIHGWKMYPISLEKFSPLKEKVRLLAGFNANKIASRKHSKNVSEEPRFYEAHYCIDPNDQIKDVFISFQGWNKGVAFVNNFNIGRFWPSLGPQCTLYVPAPILRHGKNVVVIFELHAPNPELTIEFVQQPNFTCGHFQRQV
ncbi:hypothetical protein HPP92_005238, partial [Vanilla planifolia]